MYKALIYSHIDWTNVHRGTDAYTEYAFMPKREVSAILDTARSMYESGALQSGERYPLHVTIGGLGVSKHTSLLLMATEIVGGVGPERMAEAHTWERKGVGGLKQRKPSELGLGMRTGVEFRTPVMTSFEQLGDILTVIETCSHKIAEAIRGHESAADDVSDFTHLVREHAAIKDIPVSSVWWNPSGVSEPWSTYVEALKDEVWVTNFSSDFRNLML